MKRGREEEEEEEENGDKGESVLQTLILLEIMFLLGRLCPNLTDLTDFLIGNPKYLPVGASINLRVNELVVTVFRKDVRVPQFRFHFGITITGLPYCIDPLIPGVAICGHIDANGILCENPFGCGCRWEDIRPLDVCPQQRVCTHDYDLGTRTCGKPVSSGSTFCHFHKGSTQYVYVLFGPCVLRFPITCDGCVKCSPNLHK
jgi:hypothetical protein